MSAGDQPFDGLLETEVHEIARAMYGASRTGYAAMQTGIRVGGTVFPDACRGTIDGQRVIVASAHDDWVCQPGWYLLAA